MPVEAGIQKLFIILDSRFHGNDDIGVGFPRRIMEWSQ